MVGLPFSPAAAAAALLLSNLSCLCRGDEAEGGQAALSPPPGIGVIGAGLGRTGTLSLGAALEILGYESYHYVDFAHADRWAAFAEGRRAGVGMAATAVSEDDIIDLIVESKLNGTTAAAAAAAPIATLDNPCCDLYEAQRRRYPDAKVILTVRSDGGEGWERSFRNLMDTMVLTERPFSVAFPSFFQWVPLFRNLKAMRCVMGTTHLGLDPCSLTSGWRNEGPGWLASKYDAHNSHVRSTVPPDKLLVYDVRDGWEPLCSFLARDVPAQTFPHLTVNGTAELARLRTVFLVVVYGWIPLLLSIVVLVGWLCRTRGAAPRDKAKRS